MLVRFLSGMIFQIGKKYADQGRGGAIKINRVGVDFKLSEKQKMNMELKKKIGKRAAKIVKYGNAIIVDAGMTTQEMIKNLSPEIKLTVITNALNIAIIKRAIFLMYTGINKCFEQGTFTLGILQRSFRRSLLWSPLDLRTFGRTGNLIT